MIFLILLFILLRGFTYIRSYTILLLLNIEGLILLLSMRRILIKFGEISFRIFSITLLRIAVLEAALGLCLLTLRIRYFENGELFFLNSINI